MIATSTGGVGTHVRTLLPGLTAAGARVAVCGPAATEDLFAYRAAGAGFGPVEIGGGLRPAHDLRAVVALRRATRAADLIHAHGLRAGAVAVAARSARSALPVVVTLHNALLDPPGLRARVGAVLERAVVRGADVILAASSDLAAHARSLGGRDVRLAPVSAPPMPPPTRTSAEVRAELGIDPDRPLLLAVGRLHPQKGFDTLLDAARSWRDRPARPLVVIAGDGPQEAELAARIEAESLPVRLLGRRSDVPDLLVACDVVVLTSRWEARALVAQEVLRAARPLVATAVGGLPELLPGPVARLIPPDDPGALVAAVDAVLADPAGTERQIAAGSTLALRWPDVEDTVAGLVALYAELLGPP